MSAQDNERGRRVERLVVHALELLRESGEISVFAPSSNDPAVDALGVDMLVQPKGSCFFFPLQCKSSLRAISRHMYHHPSVPFVLVMRRYDKRRVAAWAKTTGRGVCFATSDGIEWLVRDATSVIVAVVALNVPEQLFVRCPTTPNEFESNRRYLRVLEATRHALRALVGAIAPSITSPRSAP